jgi:hypothetical protein
MWSSTICGMPEGKLNPCWSRQNSHRTICSRSIRPQSHGLDLLSHFTERRSLMALFTVLCSGPEGNFRSCSPDCTAPADPLVSSGGAVLFVFRQAKLQGVGHATAGRRASCRQYRPVLRRLSRCDMRGNLWRTLTGVVGLGGAIEAFHQVPAGCCTRSDRNREPRGVVSGA